MVQSLKKTVTLFPWGVYRQTEEGSWLLVDRFRKRNDAEDYQNTLKRLTDKPYKVAYDGSC
jgi:hypothetical protein